MDDFRNGNNVGVNYAKSMVFYKSSTTSCSLRYATAFEVEKSSFFISMLSMRLTASHIVKQFERFDYAVLITQTTDEEYKY